MLAEFSVYPLEASHLSKDVAKAIAILQQSGLNFQLGPMGTCVEGNWDQIFSAIRHCHDAVVKDHHRVITTIVIDDHRDHPHSLQDMVRSVEHQMVGARMPVVDMDQQC